MLGSYAATQAAEKGWETWATYSGHPVELPGVRMIPLDIRDAAEVAKAVHDIKPDAIIHTAALVKPDECEQHKDTAFAINTLGTVHVISAAEQAGARLVHVSTDLVFNGERNPYKTDDIPGPVNYYARTKVAAETAIYASHLDWAIARTSIIYGPRVFPHLNSFSDKVIETLRAGKTINAYTDQRRCPIPAWNLADVLLEIAERGLTGVFHAVCPESSTRYEFAVNVAEVFGLDRALIVPKTMDEIPTLARRPRSLILDTLSTQQALNTRLFGFEEGILGLLNR